MTIGAGSNLCSQGPSKKEIDQIGCVLPVIDRFFVRHGTTVANPPANVYSAVYWHRTMKTSLLYGGSSVTVVN